jgi:hypothetical protein
MTTWTFDRADRLTELADRIRSAQDYLTRDRCDRIGDTAAIAVIDRRLADLDRRFRSVSLAARRARRHSAFTA